MLRRILRHLMKLRMPKRREAAAAPVSPLLGGVSAGGATLAAHDWENCDHLFYYFRIVDNYYYQLITSKVKFVLLRTTTTRS